MVEEKWLYHVGMEIEFPILGKVSALEEKGIGRFSTVFIGTDTQNQRLALKAYAPRAGEPEVCSENAGSEQTFRETIEGVCTPLDSVAINMGGGRHGFVVAMPLIEESQTLREWMDDKNQLPHSREGVGMRLRIAKNMVRNLMNLHNNGYLHGDVSVNNILVETNGDVVLIDLQWLNPIEQPLSPEDAGIGTRETVSPEMRRESTRKFFNPKSEIWSIARLILELLSPQARDDFNLVEETGVFNIADQIGGDAPLIDTQIPIYLSGDGWGILLKATSVNQISRPSLENLLEALESLDIGDISGRTNIQLAMGDGDFDPIVISQNAMGIKVEFSTLGASRCRMGMKRKLGSYGNGSGDLFLDLTNRMKPQISIENGDARCSKPLAHGLKLLKDGILIDEIISIEVN